MFKIAGLIAGGWVCAAATLLAAPATEPAATQPTAAASTTQRADAHAAGPSATVPATQPAAAVAPTPVTQPVADANGPATAPSTQPTAVARKNLDPRWKQINESQRAAGRSRWKDAPIVQTFKPRELVNLSISNNGLRAELADIPTAVGVRVAVQGSDAVYMLAHPRILAPGMMPQTTYTSLVRYDFDAVAEQAWLSRLFVTDRSITLTSQSLYGITSLTQSRTETALVVCEFTEVGKPPTKVFSASAPTLLRLRANDPAKFRAYGIPLLSKFSDPVFLLPAATDVYSVLSEIPVDPAAAREVDQLLPGLDADDPAEREAASTKLRQLGSAGVLAVLRLDTTGLSEEQLLRLNAFLSATRRFPIDPAANRHSLDFLIDCLEYDDEAVQTAAKAEIENQIRRPLDFDPAMKGEPLFNVIDGIRKELLAAPAPDTAPATSQPAPQS